MLTIEKDELQPGDTFNALWSSGYDSARAFVTLSHRGRVLQQFWTDPTRTQQKITLPVTESLRGGFTLNIWQVRDNRIYKGQRKIRVDWKNKELGFAWERFNSKLVPGGRETWILRVIPPAEPASSPPSAQQVALPPEVAVALYDDSLEKIDRHNWTSLIGAFYQEGDTGSGIFTNFSTYASVMTMEPAIGLPRSFGDSLYDDSHYDSLGGSVWSKTFREFYVFRPSHLRLLPARKSGSPGRTMNSWSAGGMASSVGTTIAAADSLTAIVPRRNLAETNFFQPALIAGSDGTVRIEFTASEALTRWRFHAFAHDGQLRSGSFADASIVTAKSLMVQPQPPRFLREGDTIEFTVKLTNRSDKLQSGRARLNFADALSLAPADARLGNTVPERSFELAPHSSQSLSWRIAVPAGQGWLTYKAVASAGPEADGEEGWLPVLSRTQLVTESLAFQLRARAPGDSVNASYDKLLASAAPDAITRHEALTVQVASNPAWYAILALPFLMEQEYECSELVFNRFYANQLAAWLAQSDPRIVRVFQAWKNTPALKSPLFKNEELKSLLIAETPWVRDAEGETAQRQNIGALFDANRIAADSAATLRKLLSFQQPEGYWTWFPGCERDEYTTTLIAAGFGRMRQIGIPVDITPGKRAISALDARLASKLEDIKKKAAKNGTDYRTGNHIQTSVAHYLYARSFYHDVPAGKAAEALAFFHEQAACHWAGLPLQSQAHIAIALQRRPTDKNNATSAQQDILRSLRERARQSPELGTYWAPATEGYFWWHAPIETHALLIECFAEMGASAEELDSLQLWLLRQKQTQAWRTTKATADAIHAILLLNKNNRLDISAAATVTLGGKPISPVQTEAGTGFFSKRIPGVQVSPDMGAISLSRPAAGISWGSMTWQYHQDLDKITAHENSSLKISKSLWRRVTTAKGTGLEPVGKDTRKLQVGDTLVIRLIFRVSHEMEFVHLKDQRGSGLEPVETRSGYRWKNNLGYYESTRDTATHFFIRHLNPGVHVFEYSVRVQHRGQYQSGIAELQCMYAPEFNAHSASILLDVE